MRQLMGSGFVEAEEGGGGLEKGEGRGAGSRSSLGAGPRTLPRVRRSRRRQLLRCHLGKRLVLVDGPDVLQPLAEKVEAGLGPVVGIAIVSITMVSITMVTREGRGEPRACGKYNHSEYSHSKSSQFFKQGRNT